MSKKSELEQLKEEIAELKSKLEGISDASEIPSSTKNKKGPAYSKGSVSAIKIEHSPNLESIYSWKSAPLIFSQKSSLWYSVITLISALTVILAVVFANYFLVVVVCALVFLIFVVSGAKKELVSHQITSKGIQLGKNFYQWEDVSGFWITYREKTNVLNLNMGKNSSRIAIPLPVRHTQNVVEHLLDFVTYKEQNGVGSFLSRVVDGRYISLAEIRE